MDNNILKEKIYKCDSCNYPCEESYLIEGVDSFNRKWSICKSCIINYKISFRWISANLALFVDSYGKQ